MANPPSKLTSVLQIIDSRPWSPLYNVAQQVVGYEVAESDNENPGITVYVQPGDWFSVCWTSGSYEQHLEVDDVKSLPKVVRALRAAAAALNATIASRGLPEPGLTVEAVLNEWKQAAKA
jgi:hypothetical protein